MSKDNDSLTDKQKGLTKENEELKVKFSQLLDQFQDYVNETEKKSEQEKEMQDHEQAKLLTDLNNTIKDLDEMSKNLQQDIEEKDRELDVVGRDNDQLHK